MPEQHPSPTAGRQRAATPNCQHTNFEADVNVNRRPRRVSGSMQTTTSFTALIRIRCTDCGMPFEFLQLPHLLDENRPGVGSNGLEARLPLAPAPGRG